MLHHYFYDRDYFVVDDDYDYYDDLKCQIQEVYLFLHQYHNLNKVFFSIFNLYHYFDIKKIFYLFHYYLQLLLVYYYYYILDHYSCYYYE